MARLMQGCYICGVWFEGAASLEKHKNKQHPNNASGVQLKWVTQGEHDASKRASPAAPNDHSSDTIQT